MPSTPRTNRLDSERMKKASGRPTPTPTKPSISSKQSGKRQDFAHLAERDHQDSLRQLLDSDLVDRSQPIEVRLPGGEVLKVPHKRK